MDRVKFATPELTDIASELRKGFDQVAVDRASNTRPWAVWLLRNDRSALKIWCAMHDIAPRWEAGTLCFEHHETAPRLPSLIAVPREWTSIASVSRLEIVERDDAGLPSGRRPILVEAGIALTSTSGSELFVVASVFPCCVEIRAPFLTDDFTPQYSLSSYMRAALMP